MKSLTHRWRTGLAILATAFLFGMSMPRASAQLTNGTVLGTFGTRKRPRLWARPLPWSARLEARGSPMSARTQPATSLFPTFRLTPTPSRFANGFKTLKRTGIAVSPGDRVGLGALTIEVGAMTESVTVTGEAPLLQTQSAERSFTITQRRSRTCRMSNRTFTNLTAVLPGVGGTPTAQPGRGQHLLLRRQREHHDGRCFHDGFRQQCLGHRGEYGVRRGGEDPGIELPGRVRPQQRPADQRGHQERHQPVSWLALS